MWQHTTSNAQVECDTKKPSTLVAAIFKFKSKSSETVSICTYNNLLLLLFLQWHTLNWTHTLQTESSFYQPIHFTWINVSINGVVTQLNDFTVLRLFICFCYTANNQFNMINHIQMNHLAGRYFSLLFWFVATYLVHVFAFFFFINTFVVLFSTVLFSCSHFWE